ncbi:GNAT family N-acetyltransferase [Lactococcus cremoris]|jgi:predicted N-acetyltransferase YhbS|uniref:GNAT family acetyltransferase n=3 Tax=Lactococcus lactis subsp. cremoris TaxID=1359 RepID=A0A084A7G9_LACLC|nr:N-acetyltransferase [Lactococcus cremoris]MBS5601845.1 N-acetyltransferase [Lactococcus lactis]ADJ59085.1 GNAT family acetyltransferase [Lactococcus cremoris subsp. cremoris NZ9000]AGV72033.1 GNAT family acetyltransferase [Lactococcus cremoris subsp. cremoris KW2]KEY61248.1 GNAT family acetyltransferase [Lactococcus cremoris subsp. cremoris GE214]KKW73083.1 ribosomal-protein-alanine acetyltransferase, rimI [Lactococcus cremoris]
MIIKTINLEDYKEVAELIRESFSQSEHGYGNEAELVDKIRNEEGYIKDLEIVAFEDGKITGHGLLSEVSIVNQSQSFKGLVLAPLDVLPAYQGKGIGAAILLELEKRAKILDYSFISILGHESYYPRFGYVPASQYQIQAPFEVPDQNFMIKELIDGRLEGKSGVIQYSEAFN